MSIRLLRRENSKPSPPQAPVRPGAGVEHIAGRTSRASFRAFTTGKHASPAAEERWPRDWRCVLVGWVLIVIIVILVLAVIGAISLVRGRA
jgi:hypothetical protein